MYIKKRHFIFYNENLNFKKKIKLIDPGIKKNKEMEIFNNSDDNIQNNNINNNNNRLNRYRYNDSWG